MKKFVSFLFSTVLGFMSAWAYEFFAINILKKNSLIILGMRLHHSLYGVFSIVLSLFNKKSFLFGFGIGIIIQHTVTDGLWFITKE